MRQVAHTTEVVRKLSVLSYKPVALVHEPLHAQVLGKVLINETLANPNPRLVIQVLVLFRALNLLGQARCSNSVDDAEVDSLGNATK